MGNKGHLNWLATTVRCGGRDQTDSLSYVSVVHCGQTVFWYGLYNISVK